MDINLLYPMIISNKKPTKNRKDSCKKEASILASISAAFDIIPIKMV